MRFCSLDPGGTTGIAEFEERDPYRIYSTRLGPLPHHGSLWDWLHRARPDVLIYETFENRGIAVADLISREYIGIVRLYGSLHDDCRLVPQSAAQGKGFWDDDKLGRVALWKPVVHERDAIRHMLTCLGKLKHPYYWDLINQLRK